MEMAFNRSRKTFFRNEEFHKPSKWFHYRKGAKETAKKAKKPELKKYNEFDDDDEYADDMQLGLPLNTLTVRNSSNGSVEHRSKLISDKIVSDKERIISFLRSLTNGKPDFHILKRIRFIFISMQTFGNLDGICMPAEVAICEFNLRHGIIDKFSTIVQPYKLSNDIQLYRAEYHSNATHRIPLDISQLENNFCTPIDLLEQILGRSEPKIACSQGVCVGLYTDGLKEVIEEVEVSNSNASKSKKIQQNCEEAIFAGKPGTERRWLVCLSQELELIHKSFSFIKEAEHLVYEGLPVTENRFILAEALVEALAEFIGGAPDPMYATWLESFGKWQPSDFETPWERYVNVFCDYHTTSRNHCCAGATATRSCFAIFFALCNVYDLSFGD